MGVGATMHYNVICISCQIKGNHDHIKYAGISLTSIDHCLGMTYMYRKVRVTESSGGL